MDRRVMFAAAGLALLAALVAVLAFTGSEADNRPLAYGVDWPVEPGPATTRSGELEEGRNETYAFELDRTNVTEVSVQLAWEDDVGEPDEFELRVTPPDGSTATNTSRNETVNLTFDIQGPPNLGVVEAVNRSQASDRVAQEAFRDGNGTWEVRVTLEDAPGRRPVPGANLETEPDGSNSYELTFAHEAYHAEIGDPRPPDPG